MPGEPFTEENAKEYGSKGGKASARARGARVTLADLREDQDELFTELYRAAKGIGTWRDLPAEKRLPALKLLLEYVRGRPTAMKEDSIQTDDIGGFSVEEA